MMGSTWGGCLAVVLVLSLSTACEQDPFRCGVTVGTETAVCDGPGEVCVCQTQRCATADAETCPDSGFRWTRADSSDADDENHCLSAEQTMTRLPAGASGNAAMCPGETGRPIECGLTDGITCLPGEECVCSTNRCARRDDQCLSEGSRHRYVDSGMCVAGDDDLPSALAPRTAGTTIPGLCTAAVRCGRAGATSCLPGETCVCQSGRCARPDPCASGLKYVDGLQECVESSHAAAETLAPVTDEVTMQCPSHLPCGLRGEVPCRSGEICVCATNRCARASTDDACTSTGARWTYIDDNSCVAPEVSGEAGLLNYPRGAGESGVCPPSPCNGIDNNCLVGETCICTSGRCARNGDASCIAAELRYVDRGLECVPESDFPETYIATNTGEPVATCALAPSCGLSAGMICANDEVCICTTNRCARPATDESCTSTGARWAYVDDNTCVSAEVSGTAALVDFPLGDGEDGVCPATPCNGTSNTCLSGETCVCHSGRCAREGVTCGGQLQYVDRGIECVPASDYPQTYVATTPDVCALAAPCGVPGGTDCGTSQVCVCGTNRCAVADDTCLVEGSRHRYADDRTCVSANPDELLVEPSELCGAAPCNGASNTCAAGETCLCATGDCARHDETCVSDGSRLRIVHGACVDASTAAFSAAAPNVCAPRRACGVIGDFGCLDGEVCDCLTGGCLLPDDVCPTSRHRTIEGECLEEAADLSGILTDNTTSCAERAHCGRSGDVACNASEVCVCTTNRCARMDDTCVPESRLRDTATNDCVSTSDAAAAVSANQACAELGCGVRGGAACAVGEFCLCGGNQCAVLDDTCESRFRLLDGACAESGGVRDGVLPVTAAEPVPLCGPPEVFPDQCGVSNGSACDGGDLCVCGAPYRDCAYLEPACSDAGYAWRSSGGCVMGLTQEEIESSELDDAGVCIAPATGESL